MANVKMSAIGLLDMLRFKNMKVQRDKIIESTPATALVDTYASNRKAAERHPLSQSFTIEDIQVRGKGDVRTYTLRRNDGQNPAFFRAGQFVVIRQMIDGKLICRPVTLACGPALTLEGKIQLTVKRVEQDAFLSAYIHDNWKVGDTVETSGPQGTFFYEPLRDAKKVIAIAGGSGITPVYAMANAIADGDEDFDMTILYGSRTKADILFQEEFDAIEQAVSEALEAELEALAEYARQNEAARQAALAMITYGDGDGSNAGTRVLPGQRAGHRNELRALRRRLPRQGPRQTRRLRLRRLRTRQRLLLQQRK